MRPYRLTLNLSRLVIYAAVAVLTLLCVVPFYLMVINASRTNMEILSGISFTPGTSLVDNFVTLTVGKADAVTGIRSYPIDIVAGYWHSFVVAAASTILTGYFGAMTGYAFALYRFRFKKLLWGMILAIIMLPSSVGLIGYYKLMSSLNLLETWWPLILPAVSSPFAAFFLRQYISRSLPRSLVEASRMDGAREMTIFHRVCLPLAMPGIATLAILSFLGSWNNYLGPLLIITKMELFTLPQWIAQLNGSVYARDRGTIYMGITLSIIPVLIMFSFFSRYLIDGISAGSVKE